MEHQLAQVLNHLTTTLNQINATSSNQLEDLKGSLDNLAHRIDQLSYTVNKVEKVIAKIANNPNNHHFNQNTTNNSIPQWPVHKTPVQNYQYEKLSELPPLKPQPIKPAMHPTAVNPPPVNNAGRKGDSLTIIQSIPYAGPQANNKKFPLQNKMNLPVFINNSAPNFRTTIIPISPPNKGGNPAKKAKRKAEEELNNPIGGTSDNADKNGIPMKVEGTASSPQSSPNEGSRTIVKPFYLVNGKRRIKKLDWKDIQELAVSYGKLTPITAKVSLDNLRCKSQQIINLYYNRLSTPDKTILYWKAVDPSIRKEMSDQLETFGRALNVPLDKCESHWASYWILYQNWRNHSDYQLKLLKQNKGPKHQEINMQNGTPADSNAQDHEYKQVDGDHNEVHEEGDDGFDPDDENAMEF